MSGSTTPDYTHTLQERLLMVWAPILGMVLVIGYYAGFVFEHAVNIPFADDVEDVLAFVNAVVQSPDLANTLYLFFEQFNEHRTGATRIAYWLSYAVGGEINFRWLVFLTNLSLLLVLYLLYLAVRPYPRRALLLLPAACVLFQLRAYALEFWTMSGYAYMYVLAFGFVCIVCLHRVTLARLVAAAIFAALAAFTLASGQVIWVVGMLSLLQQVFVLRSAPARYLWLWLLAAALVLGVYQIGYQSSPALSWVLVDFPSDPLHYFKYFLALLGNAITETNELLAVAAGAILLLTVAGFCLARMRREDVQVELFCVYLVLSVGAMTAGRAVLSEVSYALSSRYTMPSVMLLAAVTVLLGRAFVTNPRFRPAQALLVTAALAYCVQSYPAYRPDLQLTLLQQVKNYNRGQYWTMNLKPEESRALVQKSIELGVYKPPARPHALPLVAAEPRKKKSAPKFREFKTE